MSPRMKMSRLLSMERLLTTLTVILLNISSLNCYTPELYKSYRLEKLCKGDGGKVTIGIRDVVSSFYLNSSLVPGETFNCHIEMVVRSSDTGMFVYFEEMFLSEPDITGCNQMLGEQPLADYKDFVQFGRDILFVTSHLSKKYCGRQEKVTLAKCDKNRTAGMPSPALNLADRIYSEERDREMDVWIRLSLPKESNIAKTLTLVVTPFKKTCSAKDTDYRKCGNSPRCIRKELFCDGRINCAHSNESPEDERNCSWIDHEVKAPESWSMPFLEGFLFLGLVGLICLGYYGFTFFRKIHHKMFTESKRLQFEYQKVDPQCIFLNTDIIFFWIWVFFIILVKTIFLVVTPRFFYIQETEKNKPAKSEELQIRDQHDLIQFNADQYREETDTVVPVPRADPTCPPLPLPPPYSQIEEHDIVPQYSYTNR